MTSVVPATTPYAAVASKQRQAPAQVVHQIRQAVPLDFVGDQAISTRNTGISIRSQKSANSSRSRATNTPAIAPSSTSICATKSRVRGRRATISAQPLDKRQQQDDPIARGDAGSCRDPTWKLAMNGRCSQHERFVGRVVGKRGDDESGERDRDADPPRRALRRTRQRVQQQPGDDGHDGQRRDHRGTPR